MDMYRILNGKKDLIIECKEANKAVREVVKYLLNKDMKIYEFNKLIKNLIYSNDELKNKILNSSLTEENKKKALELFSLHKPIVGVGNGSLRYSYMENFDIWIKDGFTYEKVNNNFFKQLEEQNKIIIQSLNDGTHRDSNEVLMQNYLQLETSIENLEMRSLNQILYGPPGTGKTYHTINKAIEIIENRVVNSDENREELKKKFDEYKQSGQIEFITFHQSYGYEEFVEGLKAKTDESGNISYSVENGIFKKLSNKAIQSDNFDKVYKRFLNEIGDNSKEFTTKTGKKFRVKVNSKGNLTLLTGNDFKEQGTITKESLQQYDFNYWYSYYNPILDHLKFLGLSTEDNSYKNYILIIDEINRGNISKIFGELITLIEPSKRIGAEEEIKLKLPYSGDEFGVPKNLYIIGTMNTADRSIAQIDTALRRRFEFIEMMPKPSLLEDVVIEDIEVSKVLEAINERIEYIYDKDHTIGHSYFLPLKKEKTKEKLDEIFSVNIIPLLTEYFYSDWEDIVFVLNNDFIQEKETPKYLQNTSRQLNKVYEINSNFTQEQYKAIYQANE